MELFKSLENKIKLFKGKVERRKVVIEKTILERGDYKNIFSAEVTVTIPVEK